MTTRIRVCHIILTAMLLNHIEGDLRSTYYNIEPGCSANGGIIDIATVRSRIDCASRCSTHPACYSTTQTQHESGDVACTLHVIHGMDRDNISCGVEAQNSKFICKMCLYCSINHSHTQLYHSCVLVM